jgi:hypothetical protein
MVFKYPKNFHKAAKVDRINPIIGKPYRQPDEQMGLIVALWNVDVEFRYQIPIQGGSMVRGGQVLDFLLLLPPSPEPLQVFGDYWHRAQMKNEDRFKMAKLKQIYGMEPHILWGSELQTQEEATAKVREVLAI